MATDIDMKTVGLKYIEAIASHIHPSIKNAFTGLMYRLLEHSTIEREQPFLLYKYFQKRPLITPTVKYCIDLLIKLSAMILIDRKVKDTIDERPKFLTNSINDIRVVGKDSEFFLQIGKEKIPFTLENKLKEVMHEFMRSLGLPDQLVRDELMNIGQVLHGNHNAYSADTLMDTLSRLQLNFCGGASASSTLSLSELIIKKTSWIHFVMSTLCGQVEEESKEVCKLRDGDLSVKLNEMEKMNLQQYQEIVKTEIKSFLKIVEKQMDEGRGEHKEILEREMKRVSDAMEANTQDRKRKILEVYEREDQVEAFEKLMNEDEFDSVSLDSDDEYARIIDSQLDFQTKPEFDSDEEVDEDGDFAILKKRARYDDDDSFNLSDSDTESLI